jgi:ABC-type bacteriocin/lantibiotic exporter with double-glycine peptidase domain
MTIIMGILDLIGIVLLGTLGTLAFRIISSDNKPTRLEVIINDIFNSNLETLNITLIVAFSAILVLMVKTLIQAIFNQRFNRYMAVLESRIASDLLDLLVHSDFKKINKYNLSDYQYVLMIGINRLTVNVLTNSINLINDLFSTILMCIFAFYASPVAFISAVLIFGLIYKLINKRIISRARLLAEESVTYQKNTNAISQEILNAIKEIKVYNKEVYAVRQFQINKLSQTLTLQRLAWLNGLIKYVLEIGILVIGLVVVFVLILTTDIRKAVTVLTIFLAVAFRMIPNIQRIQNSGILFTAGHSATAQLFDMLNLFEKGKNKEKEATYPSEINSISLDNVSYRHSDERRNYLFKNLNLTIEKGKVLGIMGPSGVGKSTLIDIIARLIPPTNGTISYFDDNGHKVESRQAIKIGYVTQNSSLFGKNIFENVIFDNQFEKHETNIVESLAKKLNLSYILKQGNLKLTRQLKNDGTNISGGERQRISLMRAVYSNPSIYIFDEPTSALDSKNADVIVKLIQELKRDKIVIVVTHSKDLKKFCNQILEMQDGKFKLTQFRNKIK